MFEVIEPKKKGFEDMGEEEFLRECTVNEELFLQVREEIEDTRSTLKVEKLNIILQPEDLQDVIKRYLSTHQAAVAVYSGRRREGYHLGNDSGSVFPDKKSLMSQLNERPECLLVIRLSCQQKRLEILMGNAFSPEVHLEVLGRLPARRSESQSDREVEFHGISNSTFEELWRNNGQIVVQFETENDCFVEANQEMAMIIIHCRKDREEAIRGSFEGMLGKIREKLSQSNKVLHYLGNTNLLIGAGGAVKELIQTGYIDKCLLSNLHLDVERSDLEDLFEDIVAVKDITVN
jgi:hypothetical protein